MINNLHQAIWSVAIVVITGLLFSFLAPKEGKKNRIDNIDGLRYVLASIVAVSHFVYTFNYSKSWHWSDGGYYMIARMGAIAVAIFFILSGFLFISKISNENEKWYPFYIKRFFRIAPMTYVSSILCLALALKYGKNLSDVDFRQFLYWFDAGVFNERPQLFGHPGLLFNANVTWTLVYEWALYASLPLIWILNKATGMKATRAIPIMILFISFYGISQFNYRLGVFISFFAAGALVKDIVSLGLIKKCLLLELMSICTFIFSFVSAYYSDPFTYQCLVLYTMFFFTIASGATWFGLLTCRGFVLLGNASYSIYLLHSIVWFVAFRATDGYGIKVSYVIYSLTFMLMCLLSVITYRKIETPMNKYAEKLAKKIT